MLLIVTWKNNPPWKIEIDENKTISYLKKKIAAHYKGVNTGFYIMCGNKIIESTSDSKTIAQCGIQRMIRIPDNYEPNNSLMKLLIIWKDSEPWELEIERNKTILDLKKEIANHFKAKNTDFDILNGNKIITKISDSKTLAQCRIDRIIKIPSYNEPNIPLMKIIVVWKCQKPWILNIDENYTILDLKKIIAEHYNLNFNTFNILNENNIIDSQSDSRTINECGIKKMIRLPDNYEPGISFELKK